jgi:hypothetical protein
VIKNNYFFGAEGSLGIVDPLIKGGAFIFILSIVVEFNRIDNGPLASATWQGWQVPSNVWQVKQARMFALA